MFFSEISENFSLRKFPAIRYYFVVMFNAQVCYHDIALIIFHCSPSSWITVLVFY